MKYGHRLSVTIQGYDDKGRGTTSVGFDAAGKQVDAGQGIRDAEIVVPFTCRGDSVEASFVKRDYGDKVCLLESLTTPGPDRVAAACPHAGKCGGCLWQHISYPAQTAEKERGVREVFRKLELEDRLLPIRPAGGQLGYRNRMDYCVGWNGEIGLKEYGSWNKYVDVRTCLLMSPDPSPILQIIRDWMKEFDLQPWDAKYHSGDMRYVVIRDGKNTAQRLMVVVVHDAKRITAEARTALVERLDPERAAVKQPWLPTTLLIGEQPKITDLSQAETFETVFGLPYLEELTNGVRYRIYPNSFFQTNSDMAAELQTEVLKNIVHKVHKVAGSSSDRTTDSDIPYEPDELDEHSTLLDLYCGLGFFGIAAAKQNPKLIVKGYELDENAIKLASQNAELNAVADRCEFFACKAEDLSWRDEQADTLILDPPRSGLHPKVIKTLMDPNTSLKPETIIYVSCNYHRLPEELPSFFPNYDITSIQPLDLFPQTRHVEVVVVMKRKTSE